MIDIIYWYTTCRLICGSYIKKLNITVRHNFLWIIRSCFNGDYLRFIEINLLSLIGKSRTTNLKTLSLYFIRRFNSILSSLNLDCIDASLLREFLINFFLLLIICDRTTRAHLSTESHLLPRTLSCRVNFAWISKRENSSKKMRRVWVSESSFVMVDDAPWRWDRAESWLELTLCYLKIVAWWLRLGLVFHTPVHEFKSRVLLRMFMSCCKVAVPTSAPGRQV